MQIILAILIVLAISTACDNGTDRITCPVQGSCGGNDLGDHGP